MRREGPGPTNDYQRAGRGLQESFWIRIELMTGNPYESPEPETAVVPRRRTAARWRLAWLISIASCVVCSAVNAVLPDPQSKFLQQHGFGHPLVILFFLTFLGFLISVPATILTAIGYFVSKWK